MIQSGSYLNVIDNSGAKTVCCIKTSKGYQNRYSKLGDVIIVSVKEIRQKKNLLPKVKKGEVVKALIVKTRNNRKFKFFESFCFSENAVILLNKQHKYIGTRIFGPVSKYFMSTRFLKIVSMSSGVLD